MISKTRLFASLFLLVALLLSLAGPATARKPVPGITSTPQYKSLASYVNTTLKGKRNTPATASRKQAYRNNLEGRVLRVNARVKQLYQRRLTRIENRDDRAEQREVNLTRQKQARRVAQLNDRKAARIGAAASLYRFRLDAVNAQYSGQISSSSKRRRALRAQLNRTLNPIKREVLLARIDNLGQKIRELKDARNRKTNSLSRQYQQKVDKLNSRFAERIAGTKRFYKSLIRLVRENWKKTFQADVTKVKNRRDSEFNQVKRLQRLGNGYINQMPAPTPPS